MNEFRQEKTMNESFDAWYETYERDGGELLLFNTIDLEAAFAAGTQAERERCASIAEEHIAYGSNRASYIAAAIREG